MSFTKGKGNIYSKFEFLIDKNLDNEGTAINNFNFSQIVFKYGKMNIRFNRLARSFSTSIQETHFKF